jgi:phage/plasmid-associated DNA primase
LLAELPGILLWAIEGWRRLRERGRFEQAESGRELLGEMEDLSSPVGAFVRECCAVEAGRQVKVADLFAAWEDWSAAKGRKATSEQVFGRDLLAAVPGIRRARPREGEARPRCYENIALTNPPPKRARHGAGVNPEHEAKAREWLRQRLSGGQHRVSETITLAELSGISKAALFRAKELLGVVEEEEDGKKYWTLPPDGSDGNGEGGASQ